MGNCLSALAEEKESMINPNQSDMPSTLLSIQSSNRQSRSNTRQYPSLSPSISSAQNGYLPGQEQSQNIYLIAVRSYKSSLGNFDIKVGEIMNLIHERNSDWYVRKVQGGTTGYIPKDHVDIFSVSESKDWFIGKIPHLEAARLVHREGLPEGTFLIREREDASKPYDLTIKTDDGVKHYKITKNANDEFFIESRLPFQSLQKLIDYYIKNKGQLHCKLTFPVLKIPPSTMGSNSGPMDDWEIPRNQLELKMMEENKLGEGHYGKVYKDKLRGRRNVAVKIMNPNTISPTNFLRESEIMKKLDHPHLVQLYGVCKMESSFCIVMEYLENGSLLEYLKKKDNQITEEAMISVCAQVANGMRYLERQKLVHRDLAARNVLISTKSRGVLTVKVADFGLARELKNGESYDALTVFGFPIQWTAPEALDSLKFTIKSDVWSFGVLVWEIFSRGGTPYKGINNSEIFCYLNQGNRMGKPEACPEQIYNNVIRNCWDVNAKERPTFALLFSYLDAYCPTNDGYEIPIALVHPI